MAKIPFYFHSPTPRYFRDAGFFSCPKNLAFITWTFERCSPEPRTVFEKHYKVDLQPYQFVFGRVSCAKGTGLTEDEVRTQQKRWESTGFLKKAPNKNPNKYTVYEWVLTAFVNDDPQQHSRSTPNRPPTNPHNQEDKKTRSKESHHPNPSSKIEQIGDDDHDGLTDDFFYANQKEENGSLPSQQDLQHNVQNQTQHNVLIPICEGVSLSKEDLDACIKIKGSIDSVKYAIEYIMRSPGRKRKIANWPNALSTWEIKNDIKPRLKENEEMAKRLESQFGNNQGYRCEIYTDRMKDQKGLLFASTACTGNPEQYFIPFTDQEFKEKCAKIIRDKRMQQGRISKS